MTAKWTITRNGELLDGRELTTQSIERIVLRLGRASIPFEVSRDAGGSRKHLSYCDPDDGNFYRYDRIDEPALMSADDLRSVLISLAGWAQMRLADPTADHECTLRSLLDTLKELAK